MKKLFKTRMAILTSLLMFSICALSVIAIANPETVTEIVGAISIAAVLPFGMVKNMINLKSPNKAFDKPEGGDEGEGGSGDNPENALLAKIKLKIAEQTKEYETKLKTLVKDSDEHKALTERIALLEEKGENLKDQPEFKTIIDEHSALALEVKALKEQLEKVGDGKSLKAQFGDYLTKNQDKLKSIKSSGTGFLEFEFKAAAPIVTTSASNPDGIPELVGVQVAAPSNVNLRGTIVDELVTMFDTSLAAFPYTETVPKDGDYAFLAEKATKPLIDFKIETRYAQPVKVAAHIELSDESIQDIPGLQSIATDYLLKKHNLKRQNGILFGDGIAPNPKGATLFGRAFVPGGMANCVDDPNFMDAVNAAVTDIFTTHNYTDEIPYRANLCMVNPIDFYCQLVAAKDGNGLPLYPMASLFNRVVLGGVLIVPFEDITVGKIFVCDLSRYNVSRYLPYRVKIGFINDQLITNQFTMVGESRLHAYVKKLDEQAFIYDEIDTIKTAIHLVS